MQSNSGYKEPVLKVILAWVPLQQSTPMHMNTPESVRMESRRTMRSISKEWLIEEVTKQQKLMSQQIHGGEGASGYTQNILEAMLLVMTNTIDGVRKEERAE